MINKLNQNTKILFILTILIITTMLTGCVNQDTTISVNPDGVSNINLKFTVDKENFAFLEANNIQEPDNDDLYSKEISMVNPFFRKIANLYAAEDMTISSIDDNFEIGFIAFKEFDSIDALNGFIESLYEKGLSTIQGKIKYTDLKVVKNYQFDGNLQYLIDKETKTQLDNFIKSNPNIDIEEYLNVTSKLEVYTPGDIKYVEGYDEESLGSQPTFSTTIDEEVKVVSMQTRLINKQGAALVITLTSLILIVLIVRLWRRIKRKRRLY